MLIDTILIDATIAETRAAFLERGVLRRFIVSRPDDGMAAGTVVLGRVVRLAPALDAAFVEIGDARPGFVALNELPSGRPAEGDAIVVQVSRAATHGKGARLTGRVTVDEEMNAVVARPPAILQPAPDPVQAALKALAGPATKRIVVDGATPMPALGNDPVLASLVEPHVGPDSVFVIDDVEGQITEALAPEVRLPSGGRVRFAETPALVAIDVDTGTPAGGGAQATALTTNMEAVDVVARHMPLRELGGHIVIDAVPMRARRHRTQLIEALRKAVADDQAPVFVGGFTRLGVVELTRRKTGPSLAERLGVLCPQCDGAGWVPSAETVGYQALRAAVRTKGVPLLEIRATPAVVAALRGPLAAAVDEVTARLGRTPVLVADDTLARDAFQIEPAARRAAHG